MEGKKAREGGGGEEKEESGEVGSGERFSFDYEGDVPRR